MDRQMDGHRNDCEATNLCRIDVHKGIMENLTCSPDDCLNFSTMISFAIFSVSMSSATSFIYWHNIDLSMIANNILIWYNSPLVIHEHDQILLE